MARAESSTRQLTLTEELEKLEQSITLTLQGPERNPPLLKPAEIDRNFSKAHRTVTTGILPVVERFGHHSLALWEATKFWKEFFESSANVSLSGYEELVADEETIVDNADASDNTVRHEATSNIESHTDHATSKHAVRYTGTDDSLLTDDVYGSTPRPTATKADLTRFSSLESPYELLKREIQGESVGKDDNVSEATILGSDSDLTELPHERQRTSQLPDMSMTPRQSPSSSASFKSTQPQTRDRLLHRVLDQDYRLHTTHHRPLIRFSPLKNAATKSKSWVDSPVSSPDIAVPKLRSEAFMTPLAARRRQVAKRGQTPWTPGISVQTPLAARKTRGLHAHQARTSQEPERTGPVLSAERTDEAQGGGDWDSDSDSDFDLHAGMSPPKTIQFALPPSRLLQTPAREASKRIVQSILLSAGADPESTAEYSASLIQINEDILDQSF